MVVCMEHVDLSVNTHQLLSKGWWNWKVWKHKWTLLHLLKHTGSLSLRFYLKGEYSPFGLLQTFTSFTITQPVVTQCLMSSLPCKLQSTTAISGWQESEVFGAGPLCNLWFHLEEGSSLQNSLTNHSSNRDFSPHDITSHPLCPTTFKQSGKKSVPNGPNVFSGASSILASHLRLKAYVYFYTVYYYTVRSNNQGVFICKMLAQSEDCQL